MSVSWHDFIFGAFDPAGTITLDKLPGAFWIQALAVRALGFHTWVIILPHMVEGVLTVLVLYRAVSRLAGPAAGLIAALIVAASPATVALNRGNISDSLMILLLVLAADEVSAAIATREEHAGRAQALLILAAFWVGLAFQAKMIEAWLLLPALGLAYLLDGPGPLGRRVRQVVVAGILAGIVSLAWMTAVTLVPAANRPYADGSSDNSVYSQVFVYNGFGRFGDQTPVQLLASQLAPDQIIPIAPSGANRLFTGNLGRDTGRLAAARGVRRRHLGDCQPLASAGLTAHHESAFDAPFEPTRLAALIASAPAKLAKIQQTIPRLQAVQANAPDLLAAQSSDIAAVFIYTSGLEALPIGGFTGTIPSPTLAQLKTDIASHQFHLVLALSTKDPRMRWIATHCRDLSPRTFLCVAPNAAASPAASPAEPGQPGSR